MQLIKHALTLTLLLLLAPLLVQAQTINIDHTFTQDTTILLGIENITSLTITGSHEGESSNATLITSSGEKRVVGLTGTIDFEDVCAQTCNLQNTTATQLQLEINGELYLRSISYSTSTQQETALAQEDDEEVSDEQIESSLSQETDEFMQLLLNKKPDFFEPTQRPNRTRTDTTTTSSESFFRIASIEEISSCQTLNTQGTTYQLTNDVTSADTCFTVTQPEITLDCQGYTITYSNSSTGYAINATTNSEYFTARNCNIQQATTSSDSRAVYLDEDYATLENLNITTHGNYSPGIRKRSSRGYATLTNIWVNTTGEYAHAIDMGRYGYRDVLTDIEVYTTGDHAMGIHLDNGNSRPSLDGIYVSTTGNEADGIVLDRTCLPDVKNVDIHTTGDVVWGMATLIGGDGCGEDLFENITILAEGSGASSSEQMAWVNVNGAIIATNVNATATQSPSRGVYQQGRSSWEWPTKWTNAYFSGQTYDYFLSDWSFEQHHLYNVTLPSKTLNIVPGAEGQIYIHWVADITVQNQTSDPLPSTYVLAQEATGKSVANQTVFTSADGTTRIYLASQLLNDTDAYNLSTDLTLSRVGYETLAVNEQRFENSQITYTLNVSSAEPAVCIKESSNCYYTVDEAYQAAVENQTIVITDNQTYYEKLTITKPVTITHNSTSGAPTIKSPEQVFFIEANHTAIMCEGMTLYTQATQETSMIVIQPGTQNISITGCTIQNMYSTESIFDNRKPLIFAQGTTNQQITDLLLEDNTIVYQKQRQYLIQLNYTENARIINTSLDASDTSQWDYFVEIQNSNNTQISRTKTLEGYSLNEFVSARNTNGLVLTNNNITKSGTRSIITLDETNTNVVIDNTYIIGSGSGRSISALEIVDTLTIHDFINNRSSTSSSYIRANNATITASKFPEETYFSGDEIAVINSTIGRVAVTGAVNVSLYNSELTATTQIDSKFSTTGNINLINTSFNPLNITTRSSSTVQIAYYWYLDIETNTLAGNDLQTTINWSDNQENVFNPNSTGSQETNVQGEIRLLLAEGKVNYTNQYNYTNYTLTILADEYATQNHTINLTNSTSKIYALVPKAYPLFTLFDGVTTNFSTYETFETIPLILEKIGQANIAWHNSVNSSYQNYDENVLIGEDWVFVNSSALHSSHNSSANITIYGEFTNPVIRRDGVVCDSTTSPPCHQLLLNNTQITFNVTQFSNYSITSTIPEPFFNITTNHELVNYSNTNLYYDLSLAPGLFWQEVSADGGDIRVYTANAEQVAREISSFNKTTQTGALFFNSKELSTTQNTTYYIHYGNESLTEPAASSTYGKNHVWDENYLGVWHKEEDNATTTFDSTITNNHATFQGTLPRTTQGITGHAQQYNGTGDYIQAESATNITNAINNGTITISWWAKPTTVGSGKVHASFSVDSNNRFYIRELDSAGAARAWVEAGGSSNGVDISSVFSEGEWQYFTWTIENGTQHKLYKNASEIHSWTHGRDITALTGEPTFEFGTHPHFGDEFTGTADEIRITKNRPSNQWIQTEYNNQADNQAFWVTSYSVSSEAIQISTCAQLQNMSNDLNADYVLVNDIDCSDTLTWNSGAGFEPVGNSSSRYTGVFDGANFTISGLFINRSSESDVGLFGYTTNLIRNIGLIDVNITGLTVVGGLVGNSEQKIHNSYVTGIITSFSTSAWSYIGGLAGFSSIISSSYAETNLTASGGAVGGLTGQLGTLIIDSYAAGTITAGNRTVGGLVGEQFGTINKSFSTANVTSEGDRVGGLVGYSDYGYIHNSYATGSVNGNSLVGGLIGNQIGFGDHITNSYATGSVSGNSPIGGLVGSKSSNANVNNSFWDNQTTNQSSSDGGQGKTTAEMQSVSTFNDTSTEGLDSAWDIVLISEHNGTLEAGVWFIADGSDYPRLWFEFGTNTPPTHDTPILNSSLATNTTNENLTVHAQNLNDVNGDNISLNFDWRLNGTSIAILNTPFNVDVSSLEAGAIRDYSSYENNGTLGAGTSSQAPTWNPSGVKGGSYTFDGVDDYIDHAITYSGDVSISLWLKTSNLSQAEYSGILASSDSPSIEGSLQLDFGGGTNGCAGEYRFHAQNEGGKAILCIGEVTTSWQHVAVVVNGTSVTTYLNGTQTNSTSFAGYTANFTTLKTGSNRNTDDFYMGAIDEVLVLNKPLSAQQIQQLYQEGADALAGNPTNTSTLVSQETLPGQNWTVAVTPSDGIDDGETKLSNPLIVLVENSCVYSGSGDWVVDLRDNCVVNEAVSVSGGLVLENTGNFTVNDTVSAISVSDLLSQQRILMASSGRLVVG